MNSAIESLPADKDYPIKYLGIYLPYLILSPGYCIGLRNWCGWIIKCGGIFPKILVNLSDVSPFFVQFI